MALKVWEFGHCTPRDFNDMVDGYEWRMNREREKEAFWVCAILNGAGRLKSAIRPERLLGRPIGAQYDDFAKRGIPDKLPVKSRVA